MSRLASPSRLPERGDFAQTFRGNFGEKKAVSEGCNPSQGGKQKGVRETGRKSRSSQHAAHQVCSAETARFLHERAPSEGSGNSYQRGSGRSCWLKTIGQSFPRTSYSHEDSTPPRQTTDAPEHQRGSRRTLSRWCDFPGDLPSDQADRSPSCSGGMFDGPQVKKRSRRDGGGTIAEGKTPMRPSLLTRPIEVLRETSPSSAYARGERDTC